MALYQIEKDRFDTGGITKETKESINIILNYIEDES